MTNYGINFNFGAALNISVDANQLLDQLAAAVRSLDIKKFNFSTVDGGVWASGVQNGHVYSCYYHHTRTHKATVIPGHFAGVFPSSDCWVGPGQWAVAITRASPLGGNKAHYDVK